MKGLEYIKELIYRLLFLLVIYSVLRIGFYLMNMNLFHDITSSDWLVIIFQGIRFDITALIYLNIIVIILQAIPLPIRKNSVYNLVQKIIFVGFNLIGIIISLVDVAFYKFNLKRIDSEILGLVGTLPTMIGTFLMEYWYLLVVFALLTYALLKIYSITSVKNKDSKHSYILNSIAFVLVLGLSLLGMRGGLQKQPIRPVLSSSLVRLELAPLITNSPYTFMHSLINRRLKRKHYFSEDEMIKIYPIKRKMKNHSDNKPNIVYIILESFSSEYVGYLNNGKGSTPNLDSISKNSLIFTNSFANGRRSSQALVALTAGIPSLMDDTYMYSPYLDNTIYGLPKLLQSLGYSTSFFNGSDKDMLGWNSFINHVGFQDYYSKESYPYPEHDDGHWGIPDHYYLNYFEEKLSTFKEPFFSAFFTITSHHPYLIPEEVKDSFNNSSPFINSVQYADWAIGEFFRKAEKEEWFDNTIFVFTADHTNGADGINLDQDKKTLSINHNRVGAYSIPILIYSPLLIKADTIEKPIQQIDLYNTSLELAGYSDYYYSFGNSVLSKDMGCSVNYVSGVYQLISDDYILLFKEEQATDLYNYVIDPELKNNLINKEPEIVVSMSTKLKAIIQQYHTTLIDNKMKL